MSQQITPQQGIHYHLEGVGRASPLQLEGIANYDDWARLARIELERRRSQVLQGLTDAELTAIATRTIYFEQEAGAVLETIKKMAG